MTTFPNAPRLLKGGIVLLDAKTGSIERIISLQYNPESLSRSFEVRASGESQDRSEALRLRGPAVETIKLEAVLDATDQLEIADPTATRLGIHPQLAALETLLSPPASRLIANHRLAASGTLEIIPMQQPLSLFIWSRQRILPVRITELSVTEEAFDPALNPIRAKLSLGMRVLSVDDLGFDHRGGSLFMSALQLKERLAEQGRGGALDLLGIGEIP